MCSAWMCSAWMDCSWNRWVQMAAWVPQSTMRVMSAVKRSSMSPIARGAVWSSRGPRARRVFPARFPRLPRVPSPAGPAAATATRYPALRPLPSGGGGRRQRRREPCPPGAHVSPPVRSSTATRGGNPQTPHFRSSSKTKGVWGMHPPAYSRLAPGLRRGCTGGPPPDPPCWVAFPTCPPVSRVAVPDVGQHGLGRLGILEPHHAPCAGYHVLLLLRVRDEVAAVRLPCGVPDDVPVDLGL